MKNMAAYNGREIPDEDRMFAYSEKALDAVRRYGQADVINATVGALYDDGGSLVVFRTVDKVMRSLEPEDYAAYGPIAGIPGFREAIMKAVFGNYEPKSFTRAVAVPGGTAAIHNMVANYSCPGDRILTHSWHWAPYRSIAAEMYRGIEHFEMFDEGGRFNTADFDYKVKKLIRNQEHLLIILNTPAGNPTGYSLSMDDWYAVKKTLDEVPLEKKVALVLDTAYIDYAGEPDEVRSFLAVIDNLRSNILPVIACSASKTFTLYGARCAAMICLAHSPEAAEEFVKINSFSARAAWSNPPRAPQEVIARIYADKNLLDEVMAEREEARGMLLARGRAFEEEAEKCGLETLPFSPGFFIMIPCDEPARLCDKLSEKNVFMIPFDKGARVSVAAISEDKCRRLPAIIKAAMQEL